MFVGIRSGEATNSLKRARPRIKSRTTNNVHLSPNKSRLHDTGQGERRGGTEQEADVFGGLAADTVEYWYPKDLQTKSNFTCRIKAKGAYSFF